MSRRRDTSASTGHAAAQGARFGLPVLALLVLTGCGSRSGLLVDETSSPEGPPVSDAGSLPSPDAGSQPSSVVLFGGLGEVADGGYADENDTWVWTAATEWTELHPPASPSPRFGAMAASLGGDTVLFGGDGSDPETWVWNGATWSQVQPSWSPPTLTSSVFGALGQGLLLFGGYDDGTIYEDLWRWNGTTWAHEAPAVTPSPRQAPAGAVVDGSLVIFGGEDVDFDPLGDTWVFDGTSWTQMQPVHSPSPRRGAVAAALDGKLVLFGGDTISASLGDWLSVDETWTWDGTDWTLELPAQRPDARSFAGMATAGAQVVLFGGATFGGNYGAPEGTWTWDGSVWTKHTGPGPGPRNYPTMAAR